MAKQLMGEGQLISNGHFGVFKSTKKIVRISALAPKKYIKELYHAN